MNLLEELTQNWTAMLWSASLQVTIFVLLVYATSICLRRFPARYRYILWLLVLVRLAIPTSITSPLGIGQYPERLCATAIQRISQQQLPMLSQSPTAEIAFPKIQLERTEAATAPLGNSAAFSPKTSRTDDSVPLVWLIWLSGVLVLGLAIVARIFLFRRRACALCPVVRPDLVVAVHQLSKRLGLKCTVKLLQTNDSNGVQFPSVHGTLHPAILIPADMVSDWTIDALEPLLLHELIHVKKGDCLVNSLQIAFQVLYFYHPMVWFANSMIRRERELACDDDVVRYFSGRPIAYVRSMIEAAEMAVRHKRQQILGIAMAENPSNLGRRIRRMMNQSYRVRKQSGLIYLSMVFVLGLFCAAVSAQRMERPEASDVKKSNETDRDRQVTPASKPLQFSQAGLARPDHDLASSLLEGQNRPETILRRAATTDKLTKTLESSKSLVSNEALSESAQIGSSPVEPPIAALTNDPEPGYSIEEYDAYTDATHESDLAKRGALLIEFTRQFPESKLKAYVEYAHLNLLKECEQQRKYEHLELLAEQWLQIHPNNLIATAYLAEAAEKLGHSEKYFANLEKVYSIQPSGRLAYQLAQIYQKTEKFEEAMFFYACAVQQGAANVSEAQEHLERLYKDLHNNSTIGIEKIYDRAKRKSAGQD
jgi:beta-lactamase regulating signal transducer with metallopeptidase domain